jgi:hypothetical protein
MSTATTKKRMTAEEFADWVQRPENQPPIGSARSRAASPKITRRVAEFHKTGIPLVWVVDAEGRDVTVYRAGRAACAVEQGQELTGDDVLPDFRSPVADFFPINEEPAEAAG